ncbi:hypothetical protein ACQUY5_20090 [Bacillus cereus]|uniref:hypothetical protein n=1 Tax=Bacillus cereus TaxID=1396 RepID=UPI003D16D858
MEDLQPYEMFFKLKEDHELLGKSGTLFSVRDRLLNIDTGSYYIVLGKVILDEEEATIGLGVCSIDKENLENIFVEDRETFNKYAGNILVTIN